MHTGGDLMSFPKKGSKKLERLNIRNFWRSVNKTDTCWLWTGTTSADGYAHLTRDQKKIYGHRYSYELVKGPIPEGMIIHHTCNNKICVNPDHLELTTRELHPGIAPPMGNQNRRGGDAIRFRDFMRRTKNA